MPLTILCMRKLDCWNSWAIVLSMAWRWMLWWTIMAVVDSSLRSVRMLIVVVMVPNFSLSLSSRSFMNLERCFSVTNMLELVALFIAWTLFATVSFMDACARRIAVLLGFVPSMFPRCGMKSMCLLSMYVDLCSHSVYTVALRHWMWHHPACLLVWGWLLVSKLTLTMF